MRQLELTFRKKGEKCILSGFSPTVHFDGFEPPIDLDGVDLTRYSVIHFTPRIQGPESAITLAKDYERTLVVYQCLSGGREHGILNMQKLPLHRVGFYKTAAQINAEASTRDNAALIALAKTIENRFPFVKTAATECYLAVQGVKIQPIQETFSQNASWIPTVKSLESAEAAIKQRCALWEKWNNLALEVYLSLNLPKPGMGEVQILFRNSEVWIKIRDNEPKWAALKKEGDRWSINRIVINSEAQYG